ncbi:MAG: shikimate kinase [Thermoprotei archaeon]|nr:MAG: shikimate kinase [Thermoprotei archaeon]
MKGEGRAKAAVSILNAMFNGYGGAAAIDLEVKAKVELNKKEGVRVICEEDPGLALEAFEAVREITDSRSGATIKIQSEVPAGVGLKTSSAVANAVILAASKAFGLNLSYEEILRLNILVSLRTGVSKTGALDDAAASLLGGFVITNNVTGEILKRGSLDERLRVAILIGRKRVYTKDINLERFRRFSKEAMLVLEKAMKGDIWCAMTLNGMLVSQAMEYDVSPLIAAARSGAIAVGVSGKGPAIFAVLEGNGLPKEWEGKGKVIVTSFTNRCFDG